MADLNSVGIPTKLPMNNIFHNVAVYFKKNESNERNDNELGTGTLYITADMTVWVKKNDEKTVSPFYLSDITEVSRKNEAIFAEKLLDKLDEEKKKWEKQFEELSSEFKRVEGRNTELERKVEKLEEEVKASCCTSNIELEKNSEDKDKKMESVLNILKKDIESIEDKVKKAVEIGEELAREENRLEDVVRWKEGIEREEKKNNLVIFGWDKMDNVSKEEVSNFFKEELGTGGTSEDIVEVKRIGRSENKMILVRMKMWKDKKEILENRGKLKGRKVFIENDRTKVEIEDQRELARRAYIARREGRKVRVGFRKMWIDDELWLWDGKTRLLRRTGMGDQ